MTSPIPVTKHTQADGQEPEGSRVPVLEVKDLCVTYRSDKGPVQAVNHVSFTLYENEILGLVGESGSGKSTMAYAIMRLLKGGAKVTNGSIKILGQDVYQMGPDALRDFRWTKMAMVFQSAMNALNPVLTIEEQIVDTILAHKPHISRKEALDRALELVRLVRIDPSRLKAYPHELSGGMRQRVVIAIAIALEPAFVIMDEPTTALDVVVQRSILDQIMEVQEKVGFAVLFISHDFSLVSEIASRVAIMYAGRLVELTDSKTLRLEHADVHHPYTEGLLKAIPRLTADEVSIEGIPGHPPDLVSLPAGCAFHPRCPYAESVCRENPPTLTEVGDLVLECHVRAKVGGAVRG